jgi:hypothetical protein
MDLRRSCPKDSHCAMARAEQHKLTDARNEFFEDKTMATGKITQIIGAVIDVEFPREAIPNIYEALKLKDVDLTLEVQQQLGDGVVRTIAMACVAVSRSKPRVNRSACRWAPPP